MYYDLTDEQKDLMELVKKFMEAEVVPNIKENDEKSLVDLPAVKKAAELGLTTLTLPEKFGGLGLSQYTYAVLKELISSYDAGFSITIGASNLGFMPVKVAGNEYHMGLVADVLVNGGLTAFALTEATSGSDAARMLTTATKDGDDYILNGTKAFITNGAIADVFTVFATVDKNLGTKGITAFVVEKDRGVIAGKDEDKLGIRTSNTCELVFDNVRVPKKNMIGAEGEGFSVAMKTLDRTRPTAGSGSIGIAQAALNHAIKYSKERETFGKPISKHQAIQFMLADMEIQIQAARALTHKCCKLMDEGIIDSKLFSISKAFASDVAMKVTTDAVQILGGYGYSKEYPVEKLFRDAKIFQIFEGTNQIQRMIIAGHLLK